MGAQARRNCAQQLITLFVAEAVIDQLEAVQIDEEDAHRRPRVGGALQRLAEGVDELGPVGEAGELIVKDPMA